MKRTLLTGLCFVAVAVPALVMSVLVFGCCALPFHKTIHRLFPVCGGIVKILAPESRHQQTTAPGANSKPTIARVIFAKRVSSIAFSWAPGVIVGPLRTIDRVAQSAMRCDDDVGLNLLLAILLI
ncbi:MAG TPA: hypothetical protein VII12_03920 [Thermoanaerobaculia bacterium]